jgi:hypothetical protein
VNWSGKCKGPGGGDRRGALCTRFTLVCNKQDELFFFSQSYLHKGQR